MSFDSILKKLVKSSLKQLAAAAKPKPAHKAKPKAKPSTKIEGVTAHTREMAALNAAKIEAIRQNADVAPQMCWLSVLDSHTCTSCGVRDGLRWDTLTHKPIGHDLPYAAPPLHVNCRCIMTPVTVFTDFGVGTELEGQRASTFGPVPSSTTFAQFLKRQPPEFQNKVLGEERAEIWRHQKLSLMDLVDKTGRELTLAELRNVFGG